MARDRITVMSLVTNFMAVILSYLNRSLKFFHWKIH